MGEYSFWFHFKTNFQGTLGLSPHGKVSQLVEGLEVVSFGDSWPSQVTETPGGFADHHRRACPREPKAGGRSRILWQPKTTAWGRATERPQPTTQKASLTRWQSGGQTDVITLPWSHAVTVGCHLILEGRRKGPLSSRHWRGTPHGSFHSPVCLCHFPRLKSPLGKSQSLQALWLHYPRPKIATYPAISHSE